MRLSKTELHFFSARIATIFSSGGIRVALSFQVSDLFRHILPPTKPFQSSAPAIARQVLDFLVDEKELSTKEFEFPESFEKHPWRQRITSNSRMHLIYMMPEHMKIFEGLDENQQLQVVGDELGETHDYLAQRSRVTPHFSNQFLPSVSGPCRNRVVHLGTPLFVADFCDVRFLEATKTQRYIGYGPAWNTYEIPLGRRDYLVYVRFEDEAYANEMIQIHGECIEVLLLRAAHLLEIYRHNRRTKDKSILTNCPECRLSFYVRESYLKDLVQSPHKENSPAHGSNGKVAAVKISETVTCPCCAGKVIPSAYSGIPGRVPREGDNGKVAESQPQSATQIPAPQNDQQISPLAETFLQRLTEPNTHESDECDRIWSLAFDVLAESGHDFTSFSLDYAAALVLKWFRFQGVTIAHKSQIVAQLISSCESDNCSLGLPRVKELAKDVLNRLKLAGEITSISGLLSHAPETTLWLRPDISARLQNLNDSEREHFANDELHRTTALLAEKVPPSWELDFVPSCHFANGAVFHVRPPFFQVQFCATDEELELEGVDVKQCGREYEVNFAGMSYRAFVMFRSLTAEPPKKFFRECDEKWSESQIKHLLQQALCLLIEYKEKSKKDPFEHLQIKCMSCHRKFWLPYSSVDPLQRTLTCPYCTSSFIPRSFPFSIHFARDGLSRIAMLFRDTQARRLELTSESSSDEEADEDPIEILCKTMQLLSARSLDSNQSIFWDVVSQKMTEARPCSPEH